VGNLEKVNHGSNFGDHKIAPFFYCYILVSFYFGICSL